MQKLLISLLTFITLFCSPKLFAFSICDLSFDNDGGSEESIGFNMNVDLIGDADNGAMNGEYDTSDILECGDQLFLRGMYSQVSPGRWKFVFATFEGKLGEEIGRCPVGLYEGFWQGTGATEGTIYFANGEVTFPLRLSVGECPSNPQ